MDTNHYPRPKTYKDEMAIQYSYLDKIDIEKYMKHCTTGKVDDLISAIERDYNFTDFTNNDFLEGFIFNNCSEEEFVEYLEHRFGKRFHSREVSCHVFGLD